MKSLMKVLLAVYDANDWYADDNGELAFCSFDESGDFSRFTILKVGEKIFAISTESDEGCSLPVDKAIEGLNKELGIDYAETLFAWDDDSLLNYEIEELDLDDTEIELPEWMDGHGVDDETLSEETITEMVKDEEDIVKTILELGSIK